MVIALERTERKATGNLPRKTGKLVVHKLVRQVVGLRRHAYGYVVSLGGEGEGDG